jgi:integrase
MRAKGTRIKFEKIDTGQVVQPRVYTTEARLYEYLSKERRLADYSIDRAIKTYRTLTRHYGPVSASWDYASRVEDDLHSKGRSPAYIRGCLHVIEYAVWSAGVSRREFRLTKPRLTKRKARYYTLDEVRRLFSACHNIQEECILAFALFTGARGKEIRQARLGDVDTKNRRIAIRMRKAYNESLVPMAPDLVPIMGRWLDSRPPVDNDYLFISADGTPFSLRGLEGVIYRLKERAGIKGRGCLHRCRATCLTHLANQGTPEVLLQALSGHRDKRSLEAYVSAEENMLKEYVVKYLHY